jgi:Outer membrane protein beta-barrel domain
MKLTKISLSLLTISTIFTSNSIVFAQQTIEINSPNQTPTNIPVNTTIYTNPPEQKGTNSSYVGAGLSVGITNSGQGEEGSKVGGTIQGRYALPKLPFSLRGAIQFNDVASTIMPIISYDLPMNKNTNLYLGAGYGFHDTPGKNSTFGNTDAPLLTVGLESNLNDKIMIFGDTKLGIEPYQNSGASSLSVQLGAGYRF